MRTLTIACCAAIVTVACGNAKPAATPAPYRPSIDPAAFTTKIDNPFFPLRPGTTYTYAADVEDAKETTVVTVTEQGPTIMGVRTLAIHDVVRRDGKVAEDTYDWYAQHADGTVWYFGEDTKAYEDGTVNTEGSWTAGVDGAQPGIIMKAEPAPGDRYRQEYYKDHAEDEAAVVATNSTLDTGGAKYTHVLVIDETTRLEPDVVVRKYYVPGTGYVYAKSVKGPREEERLVSVKR